ncbi:MAG: bifunctional (p)ppGpp synthetase/guanosine-3',5'-bis(diphosphate) 3'-pyrophosphohydrolase [Steroidobacteraceae bacterium]
METAAHASPQIAARVAAARVALDGYGVAPAILDRGAEAAEAAGTLAQDEDLAVATLLHWARLYGAPPGTAAPSGTAAPPAIRLPAALQEQLGAQALHLSAELERLGVLQLPSGWSSGQALSGAQAEILRKMLLAVAADPRLVVARLAEQLVQLRHARDLPSPEQQRLAWQTRAILAPLANRLGVWSLKWELEDLAFRYLEPQDYRRIAGALAEKRIDREHYIESLCTRIREELRAAGVGAAAVYGRPKHIYSIWHKMQRKHVAFEQLFDVRAVRIVVQTVADCYAALGVVHGLWHYIPGEFDDYIATPKDNDYRSIHTAVIGPEDKSVEIQIRSREMHEHAELGVAAHWRYKEGGARDAGYERKIEWVRRVLDPAQSAPVEGDLIERLKQELFSDRIYAMTPHGDVIDLPRGATPLDFAYHLHTDLGHRCRGAKLNGRIVPLTHALANGDVVEIIAGRQGGPSRDWLSAEQGFLASSRSRAKVRAWFRRIDAADTGAAQAAGQPIPVHAPPRRRVPRKAHGSPVEVEGVGDLPVTIARCCGPVPPEPISGYVTLGRGVTVHRSGCPNLLRMRTRNPERVLNVEWNRAADSDLPVRIRVQALDRRGLLRDVSDVMALEKLSIDGVNSNTDPADRIATIVMRTAVHDSGQLERVLQRLGAVANVLSAQRLS